MHQAINPLTASFEEFVEILPNEVYFVDEKNFAFVEDNEIAYVLCEETSTGDDFCLSFVMLSSVNMRRLYLRLMM